MSATTNLIDQEFTQEICYDLLPEWEGLDVQITELSGGITNKLYRVQSEKGDYTVRIYGDKTDLFINRDYEAQTIREMAKIGVGSKMIKYMPERGVTIVEFIGDAIVLTNVFNPLVEVMKMSAILKRLGADYPEFDIAGTIERLTILSSIINIPESEYTACHNDLLADNFILIKEDALHKYDFPTYLIDWEYGGMAPKYYDIADMFQEILSPRDAEKQIVEAYCEGYRFDQALFLIDLFKPFPDIYWFLWSLIQLNISTIEFDYYNYGKIKYENAIKNLEFIKEEYGVAV
jgi:thiamine kinase-like enzyme